MINLIWLAMLVGGIIYAACHGRIEVVTQAAFAAAEQGITLALSIAGVMMLWLGLLAIMEKSGLMRLIARLIRPLIRPLFPELARDDPAFAPIIMNVSANLLGLGNAATPFGLKAMEQLQKRNLHPDTASNAMITFLILNTSSLTLIPALVIGLRTQAGSAHAEEIIVATILATLCGMLAGLALHGLLCLRGRRRGRR